MNKKVVWLVRKHPATELSALFSLLATASSKRKAVYTIVSTHRSHAEAKNIVDRKNKKASAFFYSVGKLSFEA